MHYGLHFLDRNNKATIQNRGKMSLNTGEEGEHFRAKPVTVSSSTSSMETASSFHNDRASIIGTQIVSNDPSLIRTTPPAAHSIQYSTQKASPSSAAATTAGAAFPSSISLVHNPLRSPATGVVIPSVASSNAVPEFLYQLTKMLTDNNRDIIEWSSGKPTACQSNAIVLLIF